MTLPTTADISEGDQCYVFGCTGHFEFKPRSACTCFQSAPCGACVEAPLVCMKCDVEISDE